jgi:hypothetical protein
VSPALIVMRLATVTCFDSNKASYCLCHCFDSNKGCALPIGSMTFIRFLRRAIVSLSNTNRLGFIIRIVCIFCEVGTELSRMI